MATINISNIQPAGSELFSDSDSYLNELTEQQMNHTHGGITILFFTYAMYRIHHNQKL